MISPVRKPAGFSHNDARSRPTIPQEVAFAHMVFSKALVRLGRSPWLLANSSCPDSRTTFTLAHKAAQSARCALMGSAWTTYLTAYLRECQVR